MGLSTKVLELLGLPKTNFAAFHLGDFPTNALDPLASHLRAQEVGA